MSNTPTLDDIADMAPSEIAALPVDMLAALYGDMEDIAKKAKTAKVILTDAVVRKFQDEINGKESGVINLVDDGDVTLKVVKKKYADWDNDLLAGVEADIKTKWKGDPAEYIKVKRSVAEAAYNAWPADLKSIFTPARTVKIAAPAIDTFTTASKG